jgi:hypothetical protein
MFLAETSESKRQERGLCPLFKENCRRKECGVEHNPKSCKVSDKAYRMEERFDGSEDKNKFCR